MGNRIRKRTLLGLGEWWGARFCKKQISYTTEMMETGLNEEKGSASKNQSYTATLSFCPECAHMTILKSEVEFSILCVFIECGEEKPQNSKVQATVLACTSDVNRSTCKHISKHPLKMEYKDKHWSWPCGNRWGRAKWEAEA